MDLSEFDTVNNKEISTKVSQILLLYGLNIKVLYTYFCNFKINLGRNDISLDDCL